MHYTKNGMASMKACGRYLLLLRDARTDKERMDAIQGMASLYPSLPCASMLVGHAYARMNMPEHAKQHFQHAIKHTHIPSAHTAMAEMLEQSECFISSIHLQSSWEQELYKAAQKGCVIGEAKYAKLCKDKGYIFDALYWYTKSAFCVSLNKPALIEARELVKKYVLDRSAIKNLKVSPAMPTMAQQAAILAIEFLIDGQDFIGKPDGYATFRTLSKKGEPLATMLLAQYLHITSADMVAYAACQDCLRINSMSAVPLKFLSIKIKHEGHILTHIGKDTERYKKEHLQASMDAAFAGDPDAQYHVANLLHNQNMNLESAFWFALADVCGHPFSIEAFYMLNGVSDQPEQA